MSTAKRSPNLEVHVHGCHVGRARELRGTCNAGRCMIVQAIADMRRDLTSIRVDAQSIRFTDPAKNIRYTYLTPPEAQKNLVLFDQGRFEEIKHFHFKLAGAVKALPAVHTGGVTKPRNATQRARRKVTTAHRRAHLRVNGVQVSL